MVGADDGGGGSGTSVLTDTRSARAEPQSDVPSPERAATTSGRRRFTLACAAGWVLGAFPFLWTLWGPWETPNFLRTGLYEDNVYDFQARAMMHGHLWLPKGAIGIEAFVHAGRQYTYFGLFPSLLRMPVLVFTRSLDGKLTAPYMLAAWILTGVFTTLLFWRLRILMRGSCSVSTGEVVSAGIFSATLAGGSVWLLLASVPYVFNEDLAWSICLTVGSVFALLGVLEAPSWWRISLAGVLVLCANLNRVTTGGACVLAAVLIAIWFRFAKGGSPHRRWWLPTLAVGLIPLLIASAVNYAKFGVVLGVSNLDQVWTTVNPYRRAFLASNHNSEYGLHFIPTNLLTYLRPDGIQFTTVFPFVTLPAAPPHALGGILYDRRYRTASLPGSMPYFFLLMCWGFVTAFRRKALGRVSFVRIPLVCLGIAAAALFIWGYIAPRYMADFMPLLVVASVVALVDIWRRLDGRSRMVRFGVATALALAALFTAVANYGIAVVPAEYWNDTEVLNYVQFQKSVSDLTGHPLSSQVVTGSSLPPWAPAGRIFISGACDGMYISNGEDYSTVASQLYERKTWMAVQLGHRFQHTFDVSFAAPPGGRRVVRPLVDTSAGSMAVAVRGPARDGQVDVQVGLFRSGGRPVYDSLREYSTGRIHNFVVVTDTAKRFLRVTVDGKPAFSAYVPTPGPISAASSGGNGPISVVDRTAQSPSPSLCRSLLPRSSPTRAS